MNKSPQWWVILDIWLRNDRFNRQKIIKVTGDLRNSVNELMDIIYLIEYSIFSTYTR